MMAGLFSLDGIVLAVLAIATVRGITIGLIREGFSIGALGGGLIAIRYGLEPGAHLVRQATSDAIGTTASMWVAGIAIGLFVIVCTGAVGKLLRRGARSVGLGFADRIGGGVIGAAEGALAAAVILIGTTWVAGAGSAVVTGSKSIEVLEQVQVYLAEHGDDLPPVAAPARWLRALPPGAKEES